jgi:hypothetical protein
MKIDTQGYEPFVIRGARETIIKNLPTIFLEYWPWAYTRADADYQGMLQFLLELYGRMYFIDEENKQHFITDQRYIDRYCQQNDGMHYCNIAFMS